MTVIYRGAYKRKTPGGDVISIFLDPYLDNNK